MIFTESLTYNLSALLFFCIFAYLHSTYCSSYWLATSSSTYNYPPFKRLFEQYIICICMSRCILHLSSFTTYYVHLLCLFWSRKEKEIICLLFFSPLRICRVMLVSSGVGLPTSLKRHNPSFGPPLVSSLWLISSWLGSKSLPGSGPCSCLAPTVSVTLSFYSTCSLPWCPIPSK